MPERGRDEDEVPAARPKLGSLAQKARGQKLKQARVALFLAGALLILMAGIDLVSFRTQFQQAVDKEILKQGGPGIVQVDRAALQKVEDDAFTITCVIDGAFLFVAIVFFVLGAIVYRFPVPVTIIGLVLFLLTLGAGLVIVAIGGEPEDIAKYLVSGWLFRLLIIIGLASSIKSALAYENERRAETEFGPVV